MIYGTCKAFAANDEDQVIVQSGEDFFLLSNLVERKSEKSLTNLDCWFNSILEINSRGNATIQKDIPNCRGRNLSHNLATKS